MVALVLGATLAAAWAPSEPAPVGFTADGAAPPVEDRARPFLVRPYVAETALELSLAPPKGKAVNFSPNTPEFAGLKLGYRGYQFAAEIAVGNTDDDPSHGRTTGFDF